MCLNKAKGPYKAKKDIVCYKFFTKNVDGVLYSPYKSYKWNPVDPEKADLLYLSFRAQVTIGLHAFTKKEDCKKIVNSVNSYSFGARKTVLRKMIIPKGSTYYRGNFDNKTSIAADTMKFARKQPYKLE